MKNIIYIAIAVFVLGGIYFFSTRGDGDNQDVRQRFSSGTSSVYKNTEKAQNNDRKENVYKENGKQIVEINVRGGYDPIVSSAKSGIPTIIRFKTNRTFDCSSSINIPSLKINEVLENTGVKDIDMGTPSTDKLSGTCGMGMYKFEIDFNK